MMEVIYVRLLDEGVEVYRPIAASKLAPSIYVISGDTPYDIEVETWEFPPGSRVLVEEKLFDGEKRLVATRLSP